MNRQAIQVSTVSNFLQQKNNLPMIIRLRLQQVFTYNIVTVQASVSKQARHELII